jgi:cytochrome c-type biogenesis protein CcmF
MNIADQRDDGSLDIRLYWKPYVALIWIGALIMALGGLVSLSDRRLRIGIAKRAAARGAVPRTAQPAE